MAVHPGVPDAQDGKRKKAKYSGPDVRDALTAWSNQEANRAMLECDFHIAVPMLPPTVNEMYFHIGHRRVSKPVVEQFRKLIAYHMIKKRPAGWTPSLIRAVIVLRSPRWVSKKAGAITRMDADNRIKPTLDAIEKPLGIPDQVFVDVRVIKCQHPTEHTEIYLRALA